MAGRMQGRRLIVTGAASGMGKAIAELFAAEGAALALLDRDELRVREVAQQLGATAQVCDVAEAQSVDAAVGAAVTALGGLDGVVNAAGVLVAKPFAEFDRATWDRLIAVNLTGPFNVVHAALPALQAAVQATIVNIASVSGVMPMAGTAGYSASKAGLIMFTKCLAFDLGPTIRANCICPGVIRTEMTRYLWENPEHSQRAADRVALKTLGAPEDIARAALYLSSEDSAFTTGSEIVVDGGFSWR
ncbi:SDR family NAD(P)-dependent oxidoreductase [Phenylobacterium sp. LjRoot219]|uniref:SDR family NAD(P)-dependent oxidoreductase n=1 Tax=Phenylobacterium sp. LjRoot219 TaxID=3342283 RepID=UPI003ECCE008